jgi:glycosyltransferase involved in cell wall biosynthesis
VYSEQHMNNEFAKVSIMIPCMNEEQYLTNLVRLIDQIISESFEKVITKL